MRAKWSPKSCRGVGRETFGQLTNNDCGELFLFTGRVFSWNHVKQLQEMSHLCRKGQPLCIQCEEEALGRTPNPSFKWG